MGGSCFSTVDLPCFDWAAWWTCGWRWQAEGHRQWRSRFSLEWRFPRGRNNTQYSHSLEQRAWWADVINLRLDCCCPISSIYCIMPVAVRLPKPYLCCHHDRVKPVLRASLKSPFLTAAASKEYMLVLGKVLEWFVSTSSAWRWKWNNSSVSVSLGLWTALPENMSMGFPAVPGVDFVTLS